MHDGGDEADAGEGGELADEAGQRAGWREGSRIPACPALGLPVNAVAASRRRMPGMAARSGLLPLPSPAILV